MDHHLVRLAVAEGVVFFDRTDIQGLRRTGDHRWHLSGRTDSAELNLTADFVLDGSGAGGFLARSLGIPSALDEVELNTSLVYGHFQELGPFPELSPGPYPDARAAVHHLLAEGWMYVLPFDHGVVSAGILLRREAKESLEAAGFVEAEAIWHQVIGRYPTLAQQFGPASSVRPVELMPRVQRRLATAAGEGWAVLPHTTRSWIPCSPPASHGASWPWSGWRRFLQKDRREAPWRLTK